MICILHADEGTTADWNDTSTDGEYKNYQCIDVPEDVMCVDVIISDDFGD